MESFASHLAHRPLCMPSVVWNSFSAEVKAVYERAQAVLESLSEREATSVRSIGVETKLSAADILHALQVLKALGLIAVQQHGRQFVVALLAVPLDHLSVPGPDGTERWFFLARPLSKQRLDISKLN